jgi:hypothetical protein
VLISYVSKGNTYGAVELVLIDVQESGHFHKWLMPEAFLAPELKDDSCVTALQNADG